MTVDGPMIHRNEEEEEEMSPRQPPAPLSVLLLRALTHFLIITPALSPAQYDCLAVL